jgi:hypothetical protein
MQFIKITLLTALVTSVFTVAEPNIAALRTLMTDSRFVGLVAYVYKEPDRVDQATQNRYRVCLLRPCTVGGSTRTTAAEWLRTARLSVCEQTWLAYSH